MSDRFPQPKIAMDFLSKKVNVPTDKWDDLKWGEHAHAFTVAHSVEANILNDIHGLLNDAIANGTAFGTFKKEMRSLMEKKGWYGGAGHKADEKKYQNWRIGVIYDTNMKTAYAAEHYRKQLEGADLRPIWVYQSKLVGDNRRQEHIALNDKAFRYDDPFWDNYYPPNGWGCECYVTTKSESGAESDGIVVGDSANETLPDIDATWKYNPGREALAPNFSKYTNLANIRMADGKTALSHVTEKYRSAMDNTRLTQAEFNTLVKRMDKKDYTPQNILYQVGNLDGARFEVMRIAGVADSKIMSRDDDLHHGTADKNAAQKIPERLFNALYETLQTPEAIYENTSPDYPNAGREFHFVKDTKDGKVLKVVLKQLQKAFSLRIKTMGWVINQNPGELFVRIW